MGRKYRLSSEKVGGYQTIACVEDTIRQRLVEWINEIIKEENLPLDRADAQIEKKIGPNTIRFPDIVIWKNRKTNPICHIELKPPEWSPFDWNLIKDAQDKANYPPTSPYFATWNINQLVLWKTYEEGILTWEEKKKAIYDFTRIRKLEEIDDLAVEKKIKEVLRNFLKDLVEIEEKKKELSKIPVDEFFIYSLRTIVDSLYFSIATEIRRKFKEDKQFREKLIEWFITQGWNAPISEDISDFEKVARQFLYLLMNKVMFYNVLRRFNKNLPQLELPKEIKSEIEFKKYLQEYFDKAQKETGDFEAIFGFDFLEKLPIPSSIISSLVSFINGFSKYDFSKLEYKDIGHIFDRLIPDDERHKLGQYYTNPDVVDIINTFCIKSANDKVADFGCGAGTFLVRAYARMKYLSPYKSHEELLKQLIGVDISKFAAHLTMINLAIRDLSKIENPLVICKDFFKILPSKYSNWQDVRKEIVESLSDESKKINIPTVLDAVVGNPPYTRQEEMEEYVEKYKDILQTVLAHDWGEEVKLGKRAGIYAYFFLHGLRFLKNGGRFGYITSNSWLDVDYGKYLQEFFLKKTKIIAVIESAVERWFEDADINTAITILERCDDEIERNNNLVKFVQLKKRLKEIFHEKNDEKERFKRIEEVVNLIESSDKIEFKEINFLGGRIWVYEDDLLRIVKIKQEDLWKSGYDENRKKYEGSKWGIYIRAPNIFFKIISKPNLYPMKSIYHVRKGYMRAPYEAFCLDKEKIEKFKIEEKFLKPLFSIPRLAKFIYLDKNILPEKLLMITEPFESLKGSNVLNYLKTVEEKYTELKKMKFWWRLENRSPAQLIIIRTPFDRHIVLLNNVEAYAYDHNEVLVEKKYSKQLCAYLNSTLFVLLREIFGRTSLGQGVLKLEKSDLEKIPVINVREISTTILKKLEKALEKMSKREIGKIFEEIGASSPEEVSLDKVKPDRRELDKIVMGEILGLTEEEQLEVYKAVVKLVKERIEKAKSVEKKAKKEKISPEKIAEGLLREIDISKLKRFPDDYLTSSLRFVEKSIPSGRAEIGRDVVGFYVKIGEEKVRCSSLEEARWIFYAAINNIQNVKIPEDESLMKEILSEYSKIYKDAVRKIFSKLEKYIPNLKLREKVKSEIEKKLNLQLVNI